MIVKDATVLETNKLLILIRHFGDEGYDRIATQRSSNGRSFDVGGLCSKFPRLILGSTAFLATSTCTTSIYEIQVTLWSNYYG